LILFQGFSKRTDSQGIFEKSSGLLFGNPIPEKFSIPKAEIDIAINQAVQEAAEQGIHGHANTPFILARIKELTEGRSIPANRALIESNVEMAAKVAVELASIRRSLVQSGTHFFLKELTKDKPTAKLTESSLEVATSTPSKEADILVFGSVAVDFTCDYNPDGGAIRSKELNATTDAVPESLSPKLHTSNIASIATSLGGVGHNVARAIHRVAGSASKVRLGSLVADDL
jgi:pseudouridine-5'-phosphate glycosidase/pseudouridine kinase